MRVGSVAKAVAIGVRWQYGIVDCDKRANGNGWDKRWSSRIPSGSNTKRIETSGKKVLFSYCQVFKEKFHKKVTKNF